MIAVIPARLGSGRLPGKVLADLGGRTMLEHVWRRVVAGGVFRAVYVASDDDLVLDTALAFGGDAVRTADARDGTHRVALAVDALGYDGPVVNVQGDQPLVDPAHLAAVAEALGGGAAVATLAAPFVGDVDDPARVKVDPGPPARFSRRPLGEPAWLHVGIYGFGAGVVARCAAAPRGPGARAEDLEQLAWLEAGIPIEVVRVERGTLSVDTPSDLARVRAILGAAEAGAG